MGFLLLAYRGTLIFWFFKAKLCGWRERQRASGSRRVFDCTSLTWGCRGPVVVKHCRNAQRLLGKRKGDKTPARLKFLSRYWRLVAVLCHWFSPQPLSFSTMLILNCFVAHNLWCKHGCVAGLVQYYLLIEYGVEAFTNTTIQCVFKQDIATT